jgi:hypothetical protein
MLYNDYSISPRKAISAGWRRIYWRSVFMGLAIIRSSYPVNSN